MIRIQNRFQEREVTREEPVQKWEKEKTAGGETRIELLEEHVLSIYVNDVLTMRVVCTALDLAELTLGRLLSEGIIRDVNDVSFLYICEQGLRAKVYLSQDRNLQIQESGQGRILQPPVTDRVQELSLQEGLGNAASGQKNVLSAAPEKVYVDLAPSCCTDNRTFHEAFVQERKLEPLPPGNWSPEQVYGIAGNLFSEDTPIHRRTGSTHSCFLLRGSEILFSAEDIGRHNALDKVIGWALLHGTDLRETAVFTSGRVPIDMARKVIRAGIPVLISKEMPTREAVELAADMRLTLIGKAREDGFIAFTEAL